ARIFPFIEQGNRFNTIGISLIEHMPWRFETAPHNGRAAVYVDPVPTLICPSSELGSNSSHYVNATLPWITDQGGLHYRAVGGAVNVDAVVGTHSAHARYTKSGVVYPMSKVTFGAIADGTSNTLLLG